MLDRCEECHELKDVLDSGVCESCLINMAENVMEVKPMKIYKSRNICLCCKEVFYPEYSGTVYCDACKPRLYKCKKVRI